MKVHGQLEAAQDENLVADPTGTGLVPGRVWFNTTESKAKFYDGVNVREFIDNGSTQTLTGKTLSGNIISTMSPDGTEVVTVPTATGEVVLKDHPQVITNKVIGGGVASDTNCIIAPSGLREDLEALPRKAGAVYYNETTGSYEGDNGTSLTPLGSGGGSGDLSSYAVFTAEDLDVSAFTNISIVPSTVSGESSYSATAFPSLFPVITLAPRSQNKLNAVSFFYTLASGTALVNIKDQDGTVIHSQELSASTSLKEVSLQYFVRNTTNSIQLEILDSASATSLVLDDVVFTDSPFAVQNLLGSVESIGIRLSNITVNQVMTAYDLDSTDGDLSVVNGFLVIQHAGKYRISPSASTFGNSELVDTGYELMSAGTTTSEINTRQISQVGTGGGSREQVSEDFIVDLKPGDQLRPVFRISSNTRVYTDVRLNVSAVIATENLVFSRSGTENTFSAIIDGAAIDPVVTSSNVPFIDSVIRNSTGNFTVNFIPGFFTQTPAIQSTVIEMMSGSSVNVEMIDMNTARVEISRPGQFLNTGFTMTAVNQGSDYKNLNAFAVVPALQSAVFSWEEPATTNLASSGTVSSALHTAFPYNSLRGDFGSLDPITSILTLPAGTYVINGSMAFFRTNRVGLRFRDIDTNNILVNGQPATAQTNDNGEVPNIVNDVFTIDVETNIQLEARAFAGSGTTFRVGTPRTDVEIFGRYTFLKIG